MTRISDDRGQAMDQSRWARIEAICGEALERSGALRAAFLEEACVGDATLRREVEGLLAQLDGDPSFLETPLFDLTAIAPDASRPPPATIGPYRVIDRLGRGGMGEVWLAERDIADVPQRFAVKVIRRGMDTDEVLARFRLERRILANLNHPNIARLIDAAATDDGRPYFVMEYVEGMSVTRYCEHRRLSIRERLALFQSICGAVEYAHQNLVVHRDLKPGNILVSDTGVPKLLDFGIGKVLAPTDAFGAAIETATDVRLLTPGYAAPEQITGGSVTTATDVYALGIVLYELLTGRHPFGAGSGSPAAIEQRVLESNPPRPSARVDGLDTRRRLAGDLDTIVLMALRKEPSRRYPSVAALADDIQRHLDGLPVRARPDTLGYRARKFVRRHAAPVAIATTLALALIATTAVTLAQSRRVARESERVARERDKALEVRGFLMEMFGASGANQAVGDTVTARQLLDLQAAQLERAYADRPELRADMMDVLADGYDRLGLYHDAEPLARRALTLRRQLFGEDHPDVAASYNALGWILHELGRSHEAESLLVRAVAARRAAGSRARADLSRSLNDLGVVYTALQRNDEAEAVLTEALAIRRAVHGDAHRSVGITANNLGAVHYQRGEYARAAEVQELAARALAASVGPDHQRTVIALTNLAALKQAAGQLEAAEADYRELLARQTRLQGGDHPTTARVMLMLATVLTDQRTKVDSAEAASKLTEADTLLRESLALVEARLGPSHPTVAVTLDRLASVLVARGDRAQAVRAQARAVAILRRAHGDTATTTQRALARLERMR